MREARLVVTIYGHHFEAHGHVHFVTEQFRRFESLLQARVAGQPAHADPAPVAPIEGAPAGAVKILGDLA